MEDNPFPAVMGRVCYHPCETVCNRAQLDEAVGISSVERFLGDEGIKQGWTVEPLAGPSGKRVLVIGAGPSGLAAAYHLARLGHESRFVTPANCRRNDALRDSEVPPPRATSSTWKDQRILDLGVTLELNAKVENVLDAKREVASTPSSSPSGPTSAKTPTSRPAPLHTSSMPSRSSAAWRARRSRCWAVASSSTAAGTRPSTQRGRPKRLGAAEAIIVYRRTRPA